MLLLDINCWYENHSIMKAFAIAIIALNIVIMLFCILLLIIALYGWFIDNKEFKKLGKRRDFDKSK